MTDKELLEKTAKRLRVIADDTQRITSGNISHNLTCLRGFALRAAESIEIHLQEPVSEELDEAAKAYAKVERSDDTEVGYDINTYCGFVAGAGWKTEQFEKNRLKHCNSITNEQAELEQGFIDQHLDKCQRMPTFLDAIEYGMKLKEQQMMAKAFDAEVHIDAGGYPYIPQMELYNYEKDIPFAKEGDKYKVILIKEG